MPMRETSGGGYAMPKNARLRDVLAAMADRCGIHTVYTDLAAQMDPTTCGCRTCWILRTEQQIRSALAEEIRFGGERDGEP